jgi:hypothetical protein
MLCHIAKTHCRCYDCQCEVQFNYKYWFTKRVYRYSPSIGEQQHMHGEREYFYLDRIFIFGKMLTV